MGCDFYTYYVLRIQYKKGDEIKIESEIDEETRKREYFGYGYDEDYIHNCLAHYDYEGIYIDNKWLYEDNDEYIKKLQKYNIDEKDVITIWKEGGFNMR